MHACPICQSARLTTRFSKLPDYLTGDAFDVVVCGDCGVGVTDPIPDARTVGKYYPPRYRTHRQRQTACLRVRKRASAITSLFPPEFKGKLLDLGCGKGDFAQHVKSLGWDVAATEIDTEKVNTLRAAGIDARVPGDAPDWHGSFDAITCWHVLEHVDRPAELLQQAQSFLKPGGVLDVTVPDFGSPQARRWGKDWFHLDVPRHVFHFSRGNLHTLIERAGLQPVRWRTTAVEYDLFGHVQSALNRRQEEKNALFEALTGDTGTPYRPALLKRLSMYARAFPRAALLGPSYVIEALRGQGGTLWVTCRKPA